MTGMKLPIWSVVNVKKIKIITYMFLNIQGVKHTGNNQIKRKCISATEKQLTLT